MLKKIFVCLTLVFMIGCPPDPDCEDCLEDCEYLKREGDLPSDRDCLDYCIYLEECDPLLFENRYDNECWTKCPCEYNEDPLPQCTMCKEEMGC